METDANSNVGQKGRFYLTKHIWVPQEPAEKFNLKMSDWILSHMPKLPLAGEDALRSFPILNELKKSHDKIKADLDYLLSHHEEIPALHEVHPRDLFVPGRAWRTFLLKIWGAPLMFLVGTSGQLLSLASRRRLFAAAAWCLLLTGCVSLVRGATHLSWGEQPAAGCPFCAKAGK